MVTGQGGSARPDQLWLLPSEGQPGHHFVADVAVAPRTHQLYTYAIPDALREAVRPGVAVRVPYGRTGRLVAGWCVRVAEREWDHTRKPIADVSPNPPLLSPALIELGLWVSEYYACPPGRTFESMLPASVRKPRLRNVTYVRLSGRAAEHPPTAKQRTVLDLLAGGERRRDEVLLAAGVGGAVLRSLEKGGLIEKLVRRVPAAPPLIADTDRAARRVEPSSPEDAFELTAGQQAALHAICSAADNTPRFDVFLLFGVPGSGKTEVYVRAIRAVLARGRQAILLVPEIALATQVVERLARRFERVAVLHSRLAPTVRARTLYGIAAGDVDVVIGTRTAVFAPCPRLGLIVVDEEQEGSFKSLAAPYFHARDVAIKRGQIEMVPVVLGSATPSLETWHNAHYLPHFQLLELPERVPGARLPDVRLVAGAGRALGQTTDVLSPELIARLEDTLAAGQQAILLHNRRGYAVFLRCTACGLPVRCTRCGAHLVYHHAEALLKCHRCGLRRDVPARCLDDTCNGRLERSGLAIQRLEEELRRVLPTARLLRLDSDTMRRRVDYEAALQRFEAREADILLGTQMVAKGLDFPGVRLVGVIDADAALWMPHFRAAEQVFQLLVQVVGRAGRREGDSLALIQSTDTRSPAVRDALRMDYRSFAAAELTVRQKLFDPPFARLVRFICADARPGQAQREVEQLAAALRRVAGRVSARIRVEDADACVIPRVRDLLRYHVVVRTPRDDSAQRLLCEAAAEKLLSPKVKRFTIDVDPIDMF